MNKAIFSLSNREETKIMLVNLQANSADEVFQALRKQYRRVEFLGTVDGHYTAHEVLTEPRLMEVR